MHANAWQTCLHTPALPICCAHHVQEEVVCRYRLEVQTSDVRKAGTSGSVYLTLTGDACTIGEFRAGCRGEHTIKVGMT